jgi:hypothetical protein
LISEEHTFRIPKNLLADWGSICGAQCSPLPDTPIIKDSDEKCPDRAVDFPENRTTKEYGCN